MAPHLQRKFLPLVLLAGAACSPDPIEPASAVSTAASSSTPQRAANPVVQWTEIAADLMTDPGPVIDSRAFAILHAAIHDAVNGIDRRYEPYTADLSSPGASLEAAVGTAARDVLLALSPSRKEEIEDAYAKAMAGVPKDPARTAGIMLGRRSAKANLERRAGDRIPVGPWPPTEGPITRPVYLPTGEPGDYDFTPPFDAPPLGPIALFPGVGTTGAVCHPAAAGTGSRDRSPWKPALRARFRFGEIRRQSQQLDPDRRSDRDRPVLVRGVRHLESRSPTSVIRETRPRPLARGPRHGVDPASR